MRDDLGHQPDALGARRVEHLAGHRQPAGHRESDELGESRRHAAAGQDADRACVSANTARSEAMRKSQPERHLQTAGERRPVDRADDRCAHLGDGGDAALRPELLEVLQAVALRLLEVYASAERRVGAGEHHRAHRLVGVGPGQCCVRGPDQIAAQRISRGGAVQRQHPDWAVVGGEYQRFGRHGMNVAGERRGAYIPLRDRFVNKGRFRMQTDILIVGPARRPRDLVRPARTGGAVRVVDKAAAPVTTSRANFLHAAGLGSSRPARCSR